jgi:diacylglycerol O-acyltransferase / wax synthase
MPFPRKFTLLDRLLIMLSVPLYLPRVAWKLLKVK